MHPSVPTMFLFNKTVKESTGHREHLRNPQGTALQGCRSVRRCREVGTYILEGNLLGASTIEEHNLIAGTAKLWLKLF